MSDRYEQDVPERDGDDTTAETGADATNGSAGVTQTEAGILRDELAGAQAELDAAKRATAEAHDRFLRARADLENVRRRSVAETERAREDGIDIAVLPAIRVFDDLGRAIEAAVHAAHPASIVPGVQAVRDTLERELENLGILPVGAVGEAFDPNLHEALSITAVPVGGEAGAIAEVFEVGFRRGDRLIRPARVVVYSDHA